MNFASILLVAIGVAIGLFISTTPMPTKRSSY